MCSVAGAIQGISSCRAAARTSASCSLETLETVAPFCSLRRAVRSSVLRCCIPVAASCSSTYLKARLSILILSRVEREFAESSNVSVGPSSANLSVCSAAHRCSRKPLRNRENLRSSSATVGVLSKKRTFAIGMFDLSITDSFQIPVHSFAMHRLPDRGSDIENDMKGSGALERIKNKPIAASTLLTDT
ncbi:hypothetical protein Z948_1161 [Sulfitobacter donghicola DSW-25 = KCTC 12864 = JCM 14565]|nr:hypothetical protein Z948_1161 [Sulfitobacter donghicola DSW-25 = KCTC 12864 = JCM 14565]